MAREPPTKSAATRSTRWHLRAGDNDVGDTFPMASFPQRAGLLALCKRLLAWVLPEPRGPKPAKPSYPSIGARAKYLVQRDLAGMPPQPSGADVYHILDTTHIPAIVRVRACRKGLFAGQAAFGRNVSKTEWVYGFKVALSVSLEVVVTAFGLARANCDERPIGEFLISFDEHDAYLADKGFSSVKWERYWLQIHGALVAATPQESARGLGRQPLVDGPLERGNSSKG